MLNRGISLSLILAATVTLRADVTVRQSMDIKINMPMPGAQPPQMPFKEILMRIKGDHGYADMGIMTVISDGLTHQVTLVDPKTKRYATSSMEDYIAKTSQAAAMPDMPEEARQMLAKTTFDVKSIETGRSDRIQGIAVSEREVTMNINIPVPAPGMESGLQIVGKIHVWKPQPAEFDRLPALREVAAFYERNKAFSPAESMRKMFSSMPGMGASADKMVAELTKGGNTIVRMHMEMFMPGLAKMMEQARAGGANVPDAPPLDRPLVEMTTEMKELSTDAVADSVFQIPAGYQQAPMEDLLKAMMAAFTAGARQ
jgi:hypothetical protein